MKILYAILLLLVPAMGFTQLHSELRRIQPEQEYENVYVKLIAEDSLQSTFVIWIKKDVKGHFHQEHTENIVIIEGKAEMTFNGERIIVKKGDYLNIPTGTKHAVVEILSKKPLKVLSIQSPYFDGKDRVFIAN